MKVLDFPQSLPERLDYLLQSVVARPQDRESLSEADIAAWRDIIDVQLSAWATDPGRFSEDRLTAPSGELVHFAKEIAGILREQNVEAPDRVVPNGDGGIVFRWRSGNFTWSLELDADGSLETSLMEHESLLCRHSLHAEPER